MSSLTSGFNGSIVKPFTPLWPSGGKVTRPELRAQPSPTAAGSPTRPLRLGTF